MTDKLRELEQAATPAPWVADDTSDDNSDKLEREVSTGWFRQGPGQIDVGEYYTLSYEDAAFIAAFRNAAPLLLDVVDAARAFVDRPSGDIHAQQRLNAAVAALDAT